MPCKCQESLLVSWSYKTGAVSLGKPCIQYISTWPHQFLLWKLPKSLFKLLTIKMMIIYQPFTSRNLLNLFLIVFFFFLSGHIFQLFCDKIIGKTYNGLSFFLSCSYLYFFLNKKGLDLNSQIQTFQFKPLGNINFFLCFTTVIVISLK